MMTSMVAPGFIGKAPGPVPQAIKSPGFSVIALDRWLTISAGCMNKSLTG